MLAFAKALARGMPNMDEEVENGRVIVVLHKSPISTLRTCILPPPSGFTSDSPSSQVMSHKSHFASRSSTELRHKAGSSAEASACWVHWVSWVSRVVKHTQGCEINCVMRPRPSLLVAGRLYKDMVWIAPR